MRRAKATLLSNASVTGSATEWSGGKTALLVHGTLATTNRLEILGADGSTWVTVATITTAGLTSYDLPAGQYRFFLNGGTPSGVYAALHNAG